MNRSTLSILAAGIGALALQTAPVAAQAPSCNAINGMLETRTSIVERINALGSENVDPRPACRLFRELDANGKTVMEFLEDNQAWCQIPANFVEGFREDVTRVAGVRDQACNAAAQLNRMERQAREQPSQSDVFGGPGLTGRFPIPQGAL
ncbi:MAG: hypothetical protein EA385_06305 [Salinarimonadaceae bacterium]|nr:MAG: hypothetical protein EA385_06305 [Salinarimonadaceae bacterium]